MLDVSPPMRPPPLLLAAALLFWGWQTDMFNVGAIMAIILESSRLIKTRWDFSDDDFARLWTFCMLLFLGTAVYAFTANEGPSHFITFFENPNPSNTSGAGNAGAQAAASFFRWLPMTFFLFVAAQTFSSREEIPMNTISLILRRRWKRAVKLGRPLPAAHGVNVSYPYFAICLFSASIHDPVADNYYFWGLCALLVWALWMQRSRRFGILVWAGALALAVALGFSGQYGIAQLAGYFGRMNPQWMFHFAHRNADPTQNRTQLGQIGRLKLSGSIVVRVEPKTGPVPEYLREATYRAYFNRVWLAGRSRYPEDFENVSFETNATTWLLVPGKTNASAVNLACYLDGGKALLPLPEDCGRLENLPLYGLQNNSAGAVLATGPGLVVFDALYGPGPKMDSPSDHDQDLSVPGNESNALAQVVSELQLASTNLESTLQAVHDFFHGKFKYTTWQERGKLAGTNETDLSRFLLKTRRGHCEYFATATTLLLRQLKIPARYNVGFAVHEKSGNGYVVREHDAHAWCLVWDEQKQSWRDFDTTPPSWIEEESQHESSFRWLSDCWSWLEFQFSKFRWGQTHLRKYILLAMVPVMVLLFFQIIARLRRRRQRRNSQESESSKAWPGLDSEFYLIEKKLTARGLPRQPNELLTDWLERSTHESALVALRKPLRDLLRLHYRCRFDPQGLNAQDRDALRRGAKTVLESLNKN
jgi:hypothetical protein